MVYGKDGSCLGVSVNFGFEKGNLPSRSSHARNSLQIICNFHVSPPGQQPLNAVRDGAADLEHQPPARAKRLAGLRDQPFNHFESAGTGKNGVSRLEPPDFELYLVFL